MRIEFDSDKHEITVNGVRISLAVLEFMTNPNPQRKYRFTRKHDYIIVQTEVVPEGK